jgi:hypothetical protein
MPNSFSRQLNPLPKEQQNHPTSCICTGADLFRVFGTSVPNTSANIPKPTLAQASLPPHLSRPLAQSAARDSQTGADLFRVFGTSVPNTSANIPKPTLPQASLPPHLSRPLAQSAARDSQTGADIWGLYRSPEPTLPKFDSDDDLDCDSERSSNESTQDLDEDYEAVEEVFYCVEVNQKLAQPAKLEQPAKKAKHVHFYFIVRSKRNRS